MNRKDINIRDPFILKDGGKYYMYGSTDKNIWSGECRTFSVYVSDDLEEFSAPIVVFESEDDFWSKENYWAPEVHKYKGKYYMLTSFYTKEQGRRSQILVSDSPTGKFVPHAEPLTPLGWDCLDATLYVENGTPYIVYCHEWVQIENGTICVVEMSQDLKTVVSEPRVILRANEAKWSARAKYNEQISGYITDGPFFYKLESGKLLMIWSSGGENSKYMVGMAVSDSGSILGNFRHIDEPLFSDDGGHGCLFKDDNGNLLLAIHAPNAPGGAERLTLVKCVEKNDRLINAGVLR